MSDFEKIRLSKLMAERGLCSRREADAFIELGWVYVDNERISTLGIKVDPTQAIALDPRAHARQERLVTILLNKPVGYVSSQPEKGYPAAISLILPENRFTADIDPRKFEPRHLQGLAPAGRLDIDSQGLLVLTQDGRIAKKLVGALSGIEKEYLVRFAHPPTEAMLDSLRHGLTLDGKALKPARISRLGPDRVRMVLREGRKRQIRRMADLVGLRVTSLIRVRIGQVRLTHLPPGQWRYLGSQEHF